jgi:hypothetical protein
MEVLYGFKEYEKPRTGKFEVDTNVYSSTGWQLKVVEKQIIGETSDWYVYKLIPHSNKIDTEPNCLLPIGFHKSRLVEWHTNQLRLF